MEKDRPAFDENNCPRIEPKLPCIGDKTYEAAQPPRTRSRLSAFFVSIFHLIFGRPLRPEADRHERLSVLTGLPVVGADLIASSAYATEALTRALMIGGIAALSLTAPISLAIAALLIIVGLSYQQTLSAYPNGGGSYIVASTNLGRMAGVVAGSALIIDYVLDVAVSVAAGINSISSILPSIHHYRVELSVGFVLLLAWGNLRGIRSSGIIFSAPVYIYILAMVGMIVAGVVFWMHGNLPVYSNPRAPLQTAGDAFGMLGILLVLRAFSAGAVALTGIEATANAVPAFRAPETKHARRTQMLMIGSFLILFLGISFLTQQMQVVPDPAEVETLTSRITRTLLGTGILFYVVQLSTALLLALAANTAFADFPRIASLLAHDKFFPPQFAYRSERLAFSHGIILLSLFAIVILVLFRSSVEALIPLFTVGVFVAFTLSQAGMVVHWWRNRDQKHWHFSLAINAIGTVLCGTVLIMVSVTKFVHGAWAVLVLTPLIVLLLHAIHRYLMRTNAASKVRAKSDVEKELQLPACCQHYVLIPIVDLDRTALKVLKYVSLLTGTGEKSRDRQVHVQAIHVTTDLDAAGELKKKWEALVPDVPLVILNSPFRTLLNPILRYVDDLEQQLTAGSFAVTVFVPEVLPPHWWQRFLHKNLTLLLKGSLLFRSGRTAFVSVPVPLGS